MEALTPNGQILMVMERLILSVTIRKANTGQCFQEVTVNLREILEDL
jgi:hypothetical protein